MIHELAMINELFELHQDDKLNIDQNITLEQTIINILDNDIKVDYIELKWLNELIEK